MEKLLASSYLLPCSETPAAQSGGREETKPSHSKPYSAASEERAALFFAGRPLHLPTLQLPQAGMRASAACLRHLLPI
jgi:hypothetical protein